jgi:hypothetical protein
MGFYSKLFTQSDALWSPPSQKPRNKKNLAEFFDGHKAKKKVKKKTKTKKKIKKKKKDTYFFDEE